MTSRPHTDPSGPLDPSDSADDALLGLLGQALRYAEPVPDHVVAAARGAVAWRSIDQELAELVFDSAAELIGVRGSTAARQLTFRSGDTEIELMLVDAAQRRLVGQLVPPRSTKVTLEGTAGRAEQTSDHSGRFSFDRLQSGPVRITVSADRPIATDWVLP